MQVRCYNGQDQFQFRCCQMYSGRPTFVLDTVLLGRIAVHKTRPTVTHVAWSMSLCVRLFITNDSQALQNEEALFGCGDIHLGT